MKSLLGIGMVVAVSMVAACAGEPPEALSVTVPPGGGGGSGTGTGTGTGTGNPMAQGEAFDYFEANVFEGLVTECAICHAEGASAGLPWMGGNTSSAEDTYAAMANYGQIIAPSDCSEIILKSLGEHAGPSLSPALEQSVTTWLTLEASENGLTCNNPGNPPENVASCEALLEEFQGCMFQAHWDGVGMDNVPLQQTAGDGPCMGCHSQGVGSAFLNGDSQLTFEAHKTDRYFLQKLVGCAYSQGQVVGLVATDRYLNKGVEPCAAEPCHPDFLLNAQNQQAVGDYVSMVLDAIDNGTCAELENYVAQ